MIELCWKPYLLPNAGEAFALAFRHPIAHGGQVRYGNVGMGQGLQVRRRAKLGSQRGVGESAFFLRPPDLFPPRFMRGEMRGVFGGGWIGHLRPLREADAGVDVVAVLRGQRDGLAQVGQQALAHANPVAQVAW